MSAFRAALGALSVAFSLCSCAPDANSPLPQSKRVALNAGEEYQKVDIALETGRGHTYNEEFEFPFVGGAAVEILECDLPGLEQADRVELASVGMVGSLFTPTLTLSYSDIALKAPTKQAAWAAGIMAARDLKCAEPDASRLAQNILRVDRSNRGDGDGGESIFIKTCAPKLGRDKCFCAGLVGRTALPNIFQTPYSRDVIGRVSTSMSMGGMGLLACGIVNY